MRRLLPWLFALIAVGIVVVSLIEVSLRTDGDGLFTAPTTVPSPSPTFALPSPTAGVSTPAATQTLPSPTFGGAQTSPGPTATASIPTPAPTAAPTTAPGRQTTAQGPTPVTGGGALPAGIVVLAASGLLRAITRPR